MLDFDRMDELIADYVKEPFVLNMNMKFAPIFTFTIKLSDVVLSRSFSKLELHSFRYPEEMIAQGLKIEYEKWRKD